MEIFFIGAFIQSIRDGILPTVLGKVTTLQPVLAMLPPRAYAAPQIP